MRLSENLRNYEALLNDCNLDLQTCWNCSPSGIINTKRDGARMKKKPDVVFSSVYDVASHEVFAGLETLPWDSRVDTDAPDDLHLLGEEEKERPPMLELTVSPDTQRLLLGFYSKVLPQFCYFTVPRGEGALGGFRAYQLLALETRDKLPHSIETECVIKFTWTVQPLEIAVDPDIKYGIGRLP